MATESSLDLVNQDSRRTCPSCNIRMSSFLHDRHSKYINCRGNECSLDNRCSECESWSVDLMSKYVKHCKSLDSKSKKARKSDEASCSSFVESSAAPSVSGDLHADSGVLTEARVLELISSSFSQLSESFSASMEASFANMETMINDRMSYVSQDVPNRSFTAPSPVPVHQYRSRWILSKGN